MQTDKQANPLQNLVVGIVGLGLIGGSMARAASAQGCRVLGFDKDPAVLEQALAQGVIQAALSPEDISGCQLLLVALYPQATVDFLTDCAPQIGPDCLVVDLCGVKRVVCRPVEQLARQHGFSYIGGHPMAGMEKSGFGYSRPDLFQGASMILTPAEDFPQEKLNWAKTIFLSLGFGRVQLSTPEQHDHIIALTSQLAHVISCAYIGSPTALGFLGFSAGSFQDMTRVARLNETMWTELFLDNADYLAEEIDSLAQRLAEYGQAVRQGQRQRLFELLRQSRLRKETVDQQKNKANEVNP